MRRLATGVPGLDTVLGGGLERGAVTVLYGPPGTGKTIMAQQICFGTAAAGRSVIYYSTLSEPHSKLVRHLEQFDFFDPAVLDEGLQYLHLGELMREDSTEPLAPLVSELVTKAMDDHPALLVIDSARALRDFTDERGLRVALYDLTSRLSHTDTALLLLGEYTPDEAQHGVEFAVADTIVQLAYEPREPVDRRWLRVVKMRGTRHLEGKHTLRITLRGLTVFPRIETLEPGPPAEIVDRVPSGVPGLDELMAGGIGSGEATVLMGPSGAGKTIFGLRFVDEGLIRGERCLYVTFQDTAEQLVKMAAGFGWDLDAPRADGRFVVHHVPLGDLDLDMLAAGIRQELADGSIRRVVIDSLAEMVFAARETDRFPAYARSLVGLIRAAGASLVITSETAVLGPTPDTVGGIVFLFHNVILLRYIELSAASGRALSVLKMRNSDHDKYLHLCHIDADGMTVGDRLEGATGLLGWSALQAPGALR